MVSDIGIIIINYNSSEYTKQCISSVVEHTSTALSYTITIVDNASEEKDYKTLASFVAELDRDNIQIFRSRINTGFGGGNMLGTQFIHARYYLFLNNDTLLREDPILGCYEFMESRSDAAVCGPQIYNEHNEKSVSFDHFTSFARETFGRKAVEVIFSKPGRKKEHNKPVSVDYINGSFMLFRAKDFDAVGGFDNNIFLYFEESDICYRLKKQKKKTFFIPTASYLHFQGISIDKAAWNIKTKIELKTSMFYVIRKNYGYVHYQLLRVVFLFRYGIVSLVKPKYFKLFYRILLGLPISSSLKQEQKIRPKI